MSNYERQPNYRAGMDVRVKVHGVVPLAHPFEPLGPAPSLKERV